MRSSFHKLLGVTLAVLFSGRCHSLAADELLTLDRQQQTLSEVVVAGDSDNDRARSHLGLVDESELTTSSAQVGCLESSADLTTTAQPDVARISLSLAINACMGLATTPTDASSAEATAFGSSQLVVRVERDAKKVLSVSNQSTGELIGSLSFTRVGNVQPMWDMDLNGQMNSAFALELTAGEYQLDLSAQQTGSSDASSLLRFSLVNRGNLNGNDVFDAADLAVIGAVLDQDIYVAAADIDDDGDNDEADRSLWLNGLGTGISAPTSDDVSPASGATDEPDFSDLITFDVVPVGATDSEKEDSAPEDLQPEDSAPEAPLNTLQPVDDMVAETITPDANEPDVDSNVRLGDINNNGRVEFQDFLELSREFGNAIKPSTGADLDGNGLVGFADFLILSENFGDAVPATSVPEPQFEFVFGSLLLCLLNVRKRVRKHHSTIVPNGRNRRVEP